MASWARCSLPPLSPVSSPLPHRQPSILFPEVPRHPAIVCSSRNHITSPTADALAAIRNSGVIACLRAQSAELALEAARAALSSGISVLEIVMTTPSALKIVNGLQGEFPSATLGVGTILNVSDARDAVKAGAKFMMSPATIQDIIFDLQGSEVLYIPGVMSPTEVLGAYNIGARVVKVYPVSMLGGTDYMSVLKKPFPHIPMVASQGIKIDSIEAYINKGASAVVLSDAIFDKEAMEKRNFDIIYELAHNAFCCGCNAVKRGNTEDT